MNTILNQLLKRGIYCVILKINNTKRSQKSFSPPIKVNKYYLSLTTEFQDKKITPPYAYSENRLSAPDGNPDEYLQGHNQFCIVNIWCVML